MEISVNNNTIPEEWVDFEQNPGLAIACLVEAFNERLALLDNNQGFSVSSSIKFVQGFTAFDYDIILYLRDGISACLGYFYDLDYDEKHLEEHKGSLKMLDLNSFDKDTVDKFINIPPRGSLIGAFKDFCGACKAILQKMTAIHFSGDVYSLKEHYTSGALHYNDYGDVPIQPPIDWFKIMLEQTGNFTKTCNATANLDDVKYDYDYKVYNVYSTGNFCNHVYLGEKKEDGESRLKDIQYYKTSKNAMQEIVKRSGINSIDIMTYSKVWFAFIDFVENKAPSYFRKSDVDYMSEHLVQGKDNYDGYSVVDAFTRFEECLNYVDMSIFPSDIKDDINYIIKNFYQTVDNQSDWIVSHSQHWYKNEKFSYYSQNIEKFINIDWNNSSASDRKNARYFFDTMSLYYKYPRNYPDFLKSLKRGFGDDWNYNIGSVWVDDFNSYHSDSLTRWAWWGADFSEDDIFALSHSYGSSNPLMFTAAMLYLNRKHYKWDWYTFSACFKREAVKIFYIDNKIKTKDCSVKIRFKISPKEKNSLYYYDKSNNIYKKYKDSGGETIVTPTNLPSSLKIGWHKGAEFKWSEKINMDWIDANEWMPDAEDMKSFEHGIGLCGIEGEIYIILDYKNGLKFK